MGRGHGKIQNVYFFPTLNFKTVSFILKNTKD